jgi:heavy metal sensor kinase
MKIKLAFSLRLTFWYSIILFLALGLFGILSYWFISKQLYNEQFYQLSEDAEQISEVFRLRNSALDISHLREETEELNFNENGVFFEIWDVSRKRLFQSRNFPVYLDTPPPADEKINQLKLKEQTGTVFNLYTSPVYIYPKAGTGKMVFFIRLGQSTLYVEKILQRIRNLLLWLIPLVLILAGLGGWYLARRAIKPVANITNAARDISLFHLDKRLAVLEQDDELGQLVQTFNDMIERIQVGVQKIQQFTADASHELRTPLTVLRGEMEVALRKDREVAEYRQVLQSGLQELEWMEKIVNDLLLLSRVDAGELKLKKKPVMMNQFLRQWVNQQKTFAESNGLAINLSIPQSPIRSSIDPDRIKQVLSNIFDNAIKFTPEGGNLSILLSCQSSEILIQCQDTGIGIPQKDLPHIFDRFYRIDKARGRRQHGSGLGLSISKSLVEAHGGRIEIESSINKGTAVNIWLPIGF